MSEVPDPGQKCGQFYTLHCVQSHNSIDAEQQSNTTGLHLNHWKTQPLHDSIYTGISKENKPSFVTNIIPQ